MKEHLLKEQSVPKARAFVIFCDLHQPVRIERSGQSLRLPTYRGVSVGLEHEKATMQTLKDEFDYLLDSFLEAASLAARFGK